MAVRDLAGRKFGRLTVLERAGSAPQRKALWRCRCACGAETITQGVYLTQGDTRSCGCLHRDLAAIKGRCKAIDLTGQTYGRLTVLYLHGQAKGHKGELLWVCRCACGNLLLMSGSRLRGGTSRSCGCLRDELARARAAVVGSTKRIKVCRTCTRVYVATGPQKDCSDDCRRLFHARDEAGRRRERDAIEMAREAAELSAELERRLNP